MELDVLREVQDRGRFFWEMFPGAKASDAWQRQREQMERKEKTASSIEEEDDALAVVGRMDGGVGTDWHCGGADVLVDSFSCRRSRTTDPTRDKRDFVASPVQDATS
jgi:hypothetical protein